MGGAFSEGQIIKLEEWFTLPTTPRIEFYGSGFQSLKIDRFTVNHLLLSTSKKIYWKSLQSAVTSNLALLDLNKCEALREDFKNYQLLRNMHNNKKGLCQGSNDENLIQNIFELRFLK